MNLCEPSRTFFLPRPVLNPQNLQKVADADLKDGGTSTKTAGLARIGTHGTNPKNSARDFDRKCRFEGYYSEIEPYEVCCLQKKSSGEVCEKWLPIILPHEICHRIHALDKMEFLTGDPGDLETYWGKVQNQTWFQEHPFRDGALASPAHAIPFRVWGDDAVNTKKKSLYVLSIASAVCLRYASLLTRFLSVAVALGEIVCLDPLLEAFPWSMGILGIGTLPWRRHDSGEFDIKSWRYKHRGERVMGFFIGLVTSLAGDLKFLVESLRFSHNYNTEECCFKCRATKRVSGVSAYEFLRHAAWLLAQRLHIHYMESDGSSSALAQVPGFHLDMVALDLMHTLHLGVLSVAIGSGFFELLELNYFGGPSSGPWAARFSAQLAKAWEMFQSFSKRNKLRTSQPAFSVARMTLSAKSDPPVWKGKASDNALVCRFLLEQWLIVARRTGDAHHQTIATTLWGYIRIIDIAKEPEMFLSDTRAADLEEARCAALTAHAILAHGAVATGSQLWRTLPKHHYLDHICRPDWPDHTGCKMNPGHGWCFSDEDFIGRLTRISGGRMRIDSLINKYLLRLHLLLERGSFSAPPL